MEWEGRQESENVQDRRSFGPKSIAIGGGIGGVIIVVLGLLFGVDPSQLLQLTEQPNAQQKGKADPEEERQAHFAKVILHDTEEIWDEQFKKIGKTYRKPQMVLYTAQVRSGCGAADSSIGPFYCPADSTVYLDLSFFQDMQRKLNAPGEFARAYVIAHEVGHHVQRELGYPAKAERLSGESKNHRSVRLELQADFLAGVWAHHGKQKYKNFVQQGDIESALNAASQIGDDRLQANRGHIEPESFTHGTSEQRMRWFKKGFDKGDVREAELLIDLRYDQL
ncbi:MAG TPA: neutral zinc metallopeptidase [Gemmataceae bacterium]|nr:neutral zinc metallopeptidase [Gemmataceae bacterium]